MFTNKDQFGKFRVQLARLMNRCQLTRYALAQIAGLNPSSVYRIMSAERDPSRGVVLSLAAALLDYSPLVTQRDIELLIKSSRYPPPHPVQFEEIRQNLKREPNRII